MKVFLSWSGERSCYIADTLRGWLPKVMQSLNLWMSEEDIAAGSRWLPEIAKELSDSRVGVLCLTPENQSNPWLLFEAGALSRTLDQTFVCPLLFDMSPAQLNGPLTQFQSLILDKDGILKLLLTLHKAIGNNQMTTKDLEEIFEVWWPRLETKLNDVPSIQTEKIEKRHTNDFLEEILTNTREQLRRENLRLEHLQKRDEKIDKIIPVMTQFATVADQMRDRGKKLEKYFEGISLHPEIIQQLTASTKMPLPQLHEIIKTMSEMSDQARAETQQILTPEITGQFKSEKD